MAPYDNGSGFKNKTLRDLMEALEVNHQFAPAYHPQSNQAESKRAIWRRSIWSDHPRLLHTGKASWSLDAQIAHTWHQHHTLHGDARSRASAGVDLPLARAPLSTKTLPEHVQQIQREKHTAARKAPLSTQKTLPEHVQQIQREKHTANGSSIRVRTNHERKTKICMICQGNITLAEGEMVRLWGVQRSSGGDAGKLKPMESTSSPQSGMTCTTCGTPRISAHQDRWHVSYLARWRAMCSPCDDNPPYTSKTEKKYTISDSISLSYANAGFESSPCHFTAHVHTPYLIGGSKVR